MQESNQCLAKLPAIKNKCVFEFSFASIKTNFKKLGPCFCSSLDCNKKLVLIGLRPDEYQIQCFREKSIDALLYPAERRSAQVFRESNRFHTQEYRKYHSN